MDERDLRGLIGRVKDGRLSRRAFVQRMVAVGLTAPMAGLMLAGNGVAMAADIRAARSSCSGGKRRR
jgi:peptide/nickel transport system substrate-binding protein